MNFLPDSEGSRWACPSVPSVGASVRPRLQRRQPRLRRPIHRGPVSPPSHKRARMSASTSCSITCGSKTSRYLDIGAWDPIAYNNTYFFYRKGFRGVLVEPNGAMCQKIRAARPEDTTLEAGIGVTAVREADYYVMTESAWNTFSKEEAEHMTQVTSGGIRVDKVIKMPLLNINDVMAKHFGKAPAYVSIDAEGWHLAILKSIDYDRFRPLAICVETLVSGTRATIPEIPAFMASQGYVDRGGSFVNTIFVDGKRI